MTDNELLDMNKVLEGEVVERPSAEAQQLLDEFWASYRTYKNKTNPQVKVRAGEEAGAMAWEVIKEKAITKDNKYFEFIAKWAFGHVVTNTYGRKLYYKISDLTDLSAKEQAMYDAIANPATLIS